MNRQQNLYDKSRTPNAQGDLSNRTINSLTTVILANLQQPVSPRTHLEAPIFIDRCVDMKCDNRGRAYTVGE